MRAWVAGAKEGTTSVAVPCGVSVAWPSEVPPSLKVMMPVGATPGLLMVTVRVTGLPAMKGLTAAVKVPVMVAFWIVWLSGTEVLVL